MKVRMLHHVGLRIDDQEVAERFYCDTLGLSLRERPADAGPGLWVDLGGQRLDLGLPRNAAWEDYHVAFSVEDLEDAVQRLQDAGVEVIELIPPMMIAMFQDPFGNWIELRKPPESWMALATGDSEDS